MKEEGRNECKVNRIVSITSSVMFLLGVECGEFDQVLVMPKALKLLTV